MSYATGLGCTQCGIVIPEAEFRLRCPACGGLLEVRYDLDRMAKALARQGGALRPGPLLRQWLDILPIDDASLIDRVTLGESVTPMVRSGVLGRTLGIDNLWFKVECAGPTLSLKDRGTSLCVLKALELGYDTVCIPSSGNNAGSVAAYAARAGLRAIVIVQRHLSPIKVFKTVAHGAKVVRVDGDMATASRVCGALLERHRWFHCGGANPYRATAKRTVAYEMVQQLGGIVPDAVAFPVGGATGMAAAYTGFLEMRAMGLIPSLPRLIGVQLDACDPLTRAFDAGSEEIQAVPVKPSVSDAILNNHPTQGVQALRAARSTNGVFVSVSDEECVRAIRDLATREGLFVEPAGGVSVAGVANIVRDRRLEGLRTVVCLLTGHGLNLPGGIVDVNAMPEVIAPEVSAVEAYLSR
jgi:threonine synthase